MLFIIITQLQHRVKTKRRKTKRRNFVREATKANKILVLLRTYHILFM